MLFKASIKVDQRGSVTIFTVYTKGDYLGNFLSRKSHLQSQDDQVHHECEIMEKEQEASNSRTIWDNCQKNPGHKNFIAVQDFTSKHLSCGMNDEIFYDEIKTLANLVVRIRVECTSLDRPDDDKLSEYRGTDKLRVGSGFVNSDSVSGPKCNKMCPCDECDGKLARKYWKFSVWTVCHVVYNTEEAKETKVDFFYDTQSCQREGLMKTARAVKVVISNPVLDACQILCVTHDETLVKRIKSIKKYMREHKSKYPSGMHHIMPKFLGDGAHLGSVNVVIVSHPHGQPKKITVGKLISRQGFYCFKYETATCPGSSGAPLFMMDSLCFGPRLGYAHTGTCSKISTRKKFNQVNYCVRLFY